MYSGLSGVPAAGSGEGSLGHPMAVGVPHVTTKQAN